MATFWKRKTPALSIILFGIVDVTLFISVSDSHFGYWPATILLIAILLTILNNVRITRLTGKKIKRNNQSDMGPG